MKTLTRAIPLLMVMVVSMPSGSFGGGADDISHQTLDASAAEQSPLDQELLECMTQARLPSVTACIIKDDRLAWHNAYGLADVEQTIPATLETVYMAGSISKVFTATAFLQLYEQGYFDLDGDVSIYLPFPLRNPHFPDVPISFRMLLAHQSSLQERLSAFLYFDLAAYPLDRLKEYLTPGGRLYDPQVWSSSYGPGEGFEYANIGYEVLRYLFLLIRGETLEAYCAEHIFAPLGMTQTGFHLSDFSVSKLAVPYTWRGWTYVPFPHHDGGMTAAGGIRTTIVDLARFFSAHMSGGVYQGVRILEPDTVELMHREQYPENPDPFLSYGLGWMMEWSDGEIYEGHSGSVFGSVAFMFYRPTDRVGVIILANKNRVVQPIPHPLESAGFIDLQEALFAYGSSLP